jgi:hypothetical protein
MKWDVSLFRHHGVLLCSQAFRSQTIPLESLRVLLQEVCGIPCGTLSEEHFFEELSQHPDVFVASRQRAQLRLDDVRAVQNLCLYYPQKATRRFFFIENAERLNPSAANSLLKILEEPQVPCLFLLTTSRVSQVLPTITSRVQKIAVSFESHAKSLTFGSLTEESQAWLRVQVNGMPLSLDGRVSSAPGELSLRLARCEALAKEASLDELQAFLVISVQERLKRESLFLPVARSLLSYLSQWKEAEAYHPSIFLWLFGFLSLSSGQSPSPLRF